MKSRSLTTRENTAPSWLKKQADKGSFGSKETDLPEKEVQAKVFTVLQMCEDLCLLEAPTEIPERDDLLKSAQAILDSVGNSPGSENQSFTSTLLGSSGSPLEYSDEKEKRSQKLDTRKEYKEKLTAKIESALESKQVWEALRPHLESELNLFASHWETLRAIRSAEQKIDMLEEAGQVLTIEAKQNHGRLTADEENVLKRFKALQKKLSTENRKTIDTNEDETLDGFMAFGNLRDYKAQAERTGFVRTPTVKQLISKTRNALIAGKKVFLLSPTGTGKTAMAGEVLSTLKGGVQVVACHEGMTPRDFHGYQEMQDGNTFWSAGPYEKAKTEGEGLLVDEVSTAPNRVLLELKSNMFKDRDLAVIFTGNPKDEHTEDRERMDPALLREMSGIKMDYIPATESRDIILAGLSKSWGIPLSKEEVGLIGKLCVAASEMQQLHMLNGDVEAKKTLGYDENDLIRNKFLDPGTLFSLFLEWEKDRAEGKAFSVYLGEQLQSFIEDNGTLRMPEENELLQKILYKRGVITADTGEVASPKLKSEQNYVLPSEMDFLAPERSVVSGYEDTTTTTEPETTSDAPPESAEQLMGKNFFGPKDWADIYPGFPVAPEDIPPLPDNIESILNEDCPFSEKNEKIKDTHILFLLPEKVGEKDYTIDHMRDMTDKQTTPHKGTKFWHDRQKGGKACFWFDDKDRHGEFAYTASESQWVLMPKTVAPETKDKNYTNQSREVAQYSEYETVWANQLTMGIMLHFAKTGEKIFEKEYGWCQDKTLEGLRVGAGKFDTGGLRLASDDSDRALGNLGLALVRKFS